MKIQSWTPQKLRTAAQTLAKQDKDLGRILKLLPKLEGKYQSIRGILPTQADKDEPLFEALATSICYQQLHAKAAATIHGRLLDLFPGRTLDPKLLATLDEAKLKSAGLSASKMAALKDLAAKSLDGTLPKDTELSQLSDAELIERITQVRGIGPWTVQMMLIFKLGRMDVCASTDYGVLNGFKILKGRRQMPKPKRFIKLTEAWAPYRSLACWLMWRVVDLKKTNSWS